MANYVSTIDYKFKVTNNLDKADAPQKKFNFYIGLPYSKRKYRYMQVINFATNKDGQHLFNVVLGHSESSVAAMTEDILRGTNASLKPAKTKVMRITYASVNVGQTSILYNDANKKTLDAADWTGISGEYMKIKSFRTNGNDEVIGLIFDAADRNIVSARKNDSTNVVAKTEVPVDIVKVPQPEEPIIDLDEVKPGPDLLTPTARKAIKDSIDDLRKANQELEQKLKEKEKIISDQKSTIENLEKGFNILNDDYQKIKAIKDSVDDLRTTNQELEQKVKDRDQCIKGLMEDIELITKENAKLKNQLKANPTKPDETQKTFRDKFIDRIVDAFREKVKSLTDDELLMKGTKL